MKRTKHKQKTFFDEDNLLKWQKEWQDMPEFVHEDLEPIKQVIVSFATKEDFERFSKLVDQKIRYRTTKSIWFPKATIERYMDKLYINKSTEDKNGKINIINNEKTRYNY